MYTFFRAGGKPVLNIMLCYLSYSQSIYISEKQGLLEERASFEIYGQKERQTGTTAGSSC